MVRAIAGTLTLVGSGRWPEARVAEVVAAEDRARAGPTAPPQGLCLMAVRYDLGAGQHADVAVDDDQQEE
jgi:tRNA pseudouridine38-40 synthase